MNVLEVPGKKRREEKGISPIIDIIDLGKKRG
jgi:hypothetical protein